MKLRLTLYSILFPVLLIAQSSNTTWYDTLWIYGPSIDSTYGFTIENPIKVGGGFIPVNVYRYLKNLSDSNRVSISFKRIGSFAHSNPDREYPLTGFMISNGDKEYPVYFDQYDWEKPKIIKGYRWLETRQESYTMINCDSTQHCFGYFFARYAPSYKGNWINKIMYGYGEMRYPDGSIYIGNFKDGAFYGYGSFYSSDGAKYIGEWVLGKKEGYGRFYFRPQHEVDFIEGTFQNDNPLGPFRVVYKNGKEETFEFSKEDYRL